jgi:Tfp pilus assembly protein PilV
MARLSDDRGETLIELVITILIIGVGLVAVVSMLGSGIIASDAHRGMAEGEVILRDYGEALKNLADTNRDDPDTATSEYEHCPTWGSTAALTPTFTPPSGWNAPTITKVEWWIPGTFPDGTFSDDRDDCTDVFDACTDGLPSCDPGVQRVTYTVSNTRSGYAETDLTGRIVLRRSNDVTP